MPANDNMSPKAEASARRTDGVIKLSDILTAAVSFSADPSSESKYNMVQALINSIIVRERLTLMEKQIALIEIIGSISGDESQDAVTLSVATELSKYFNGLFKYATNLEIDIDHTLLDISIYDALEAFGFSAYMRRFCDADYQHLCEMVQNALNFRDIDRVVGTAALFNEKNLQEFKETVSTLKNTLTQERIDQMKAIATAGDPAWQALKETVADEVVGNVMHHEVKVLEGEEEEGEENSEGGE